MLCCRVIDNPCMDPTLQKIDDCLTDLNALNAKFMNPPADMPPIRLQMGEVVSTLTTCVGDMAAALHRLDERLTTIEPAR